MIAPFVFAYVLFAIRTFLHALLGLFGLDSLSFVIWFKFEVWVQGQCDLGYSCCVRVWHRLKLLVFEYSDLDVILLLNCSLPILSWVINIGFHRHIIIKINLLDYDELIPVKTTCVWSSIASVVFFWCFSILDAPFVVHLPLASCLQYIHLAFSEVSVALKHFRPGQHNSWVLLNHGCEVSKGWVSGL